MSDVNHSAADSDYAPSLYDRMASQLTVQRDWSDVAQRLLPRLMAGVGAVVLLVVIGVLAFRVTFDDKIYPAIVVGDVQVGGMTAQEATDVVQERADILNRDAINFTYNGMTWSPTLAEIGATIDTNTSVAEAVAAGRDDDAVSRLAFTGNILQADQTVPLETSLDPTRLEAWFDKVDADIANPAIDATIVINGTEVTFTPDSTGIVIDREAARNQIMQVLTTLQPVDTELPTVVDQPRLRTADLEAGRAQVQEILSAPVNVTFEGASYTIEPAAVSPFMSVDSARVDGEVKVDVDFDRAALSSYLRETYAGEVNREPVNATVAWSDGLYATSESVDGANLLSNEFANVLAESYLNGHSSFEIPVHVNKPQVDSNNLGALGITSQIGRGDSNFAGGSSSRDHNIRLGIQSVNGTLVAPGQDFSFNGAVGAITEEAGYTVSDVILGESIGRDVGGGICQVSTTTFRAALMAGFPMVQWYPHTYRLMGYEADGWGPGFDASILQLGSNPAEWADFSFTNTTDSWILLQSYESYPYHVVEIYGHDMGWSVDIHSEWQTVTSNGKDVWDVNSSLPAGTLRVKTVPADGLDVGFTRTVTDANGQIVSDRVFHSPFQPKGYHYEASPDMNGQKP